MSTGHSRLLASADKHGAGCTREPGLSLPTHSPSCLGTRSPAPPQEGGFHSRSFFTRVSPAHTEAQARGGQVD